MKYLVTALLIGSSILVKGQDDYLVTLKGDTTFGEISIFQSTYYDEVQVKFNKKKEVFKAFQLQSVLMNDKPFEPINHNNKRIMAQAISKGKLSLYTIRPEDGNSYTERVLYKQEKSFLITNISFRKRIAVFLDDCPSLIDRIKAKELGSTDIDEIMQIYNSCEQSVEIPSEEPTDRNAELISFSRLLYDVTSKLEKGEDIPDYMVEALEKYASYSIDEELKKFLLELKKD